MEHNVYFWLKDSHKNTEYCASFEKELAMLVKLPSVARGVWGKPAPIPPRLVVIDSWDYALSMTFANLADHDGYQVDTDHLAFIVKNKDSWEKVNVFDIEPRV
jgi:Stress responsive A/B Barrel Domain